VPTLTPGNAERANALNIELGHGAKYDREICIDELSITA
jgi:hypothetical protein